jgi:hypothetical protein
MVNMTQDVRDLVEKALYQISKPYSPDVIDEVAAEIEKNALPEYNNCCSKLPKRVVNQSIGRWTQKIVEGETLPGKFPAIRSTIIKSYSRLRIR